ncbi:MAG TPA: hypothetical protein PL140_03355 [Ferrovaceae bacterium]|nr:hypothetical protein [Ferrovaceae bacterium]HQU06272.1 hypothetical protein [Ferrovaceae bacterium]
MMCIATQITSVRAAMLVYRYGNECPRLGHRPNDDKQGHIYADLVRQWRPDSVRERPRPSIGKDWNDEL